MGRGCRVLLGAIDEDSLIVHRYNFNDSEKKNLDCDGARAARRARDRYDVRSPRATGCRTPVRVVCNPRRHAPIPYQSPHPLRAAWCPGRARVGVAGAPRGRGSRVALASARPQSRRVRTRVRCVAGMTRYSDIAGLISNGRPL